MYKPDEFYIKLANISNLIAAIMLINMLGQVLFFNASFDDKFWGLHIEFYFGIMLFLFIIGTYSKFVFWKHKQEKR